MIIHEMLKSAIAEASRRRVDLKAKLFRGLADLSRLRILEALRDGPRPAGELAEAAGLTLTNASMHLDCLYCCGLVDRKRKGRYVFYRIKSRRIVRLLDLGESALDEVASRILECSRYEE